jgi:glycosyltransferase involved in cell wall biosynthesis
MTEAVAPEGDRPRQLTRPRLKVVFVVPVLDVGGAERVALRTAARLPRDQFDPTLLGFVRGPGRLVDEAHASGVDLVCLHEAAGRPWSVVPRFAAWLRRTRPHVLLSFMFHANVTARIVGRLTGVPVIITSERIVGWEPRWRILLNRWTASLADGLTTNSRAGASFWARALGRPVDQIRVIYNGVDTEVFTPAPHPVAQPLRIGNLARLHVKNGHCYLFQALAELRRGWAAAPPWELVIAGDGPERAPLERLVDTLGLSDRVRLARHVETPASFLQTLTLYVQPSIAEGLSNAVIEAMATGLPVVATAVGGTPELVVDGVTGYLVPPESPEALAAAIRSVLETPAKAWQMGKAARYRVEEQFSVDRMVDDTSALIGELWTHAYASAAASRRIDPRTG